MGTDSGPIRSILSDMRTLPIVALVALTLGSACKPSEPERQPVTVQPGQASAGIELRLTVEGDRDRAVVVLKRRLEGLADEEAGFREGDVRPIGDDGILVGVTVSVGASCDKGRLDEWAGRLKRLATRSGRLGFHIAVERLPAGLVETIAKHIGREVVASSAGGSAFDVPGMDAEVLRTKLADLAPRAGLAFVVEDGPWRGGGALAPARLARGWLVNAQPDVPGKHIVEAEIVYDEQTNQPWVSVSFDKPGQELLADVSGANVKRFMAIVLEGAARSVPVIQERIPGGRARITLGQHASMEGTMREARELTVVLEAGPIDAKLSVDALTPMCLPPGSP